MFNMKTSRILARGSGWLRAAGGTSGFTLIELLAVVAIICVLAASATRFFNMSGEGVQGTVDSLSSIVSVARTQAIETGTSTYLLINNDPTDPIRYLHYALLAQQEGAGLEAISKGIFFGQNVYYSSAYSDPGTAMVLNGKTYLAYTFLENGCISPSSRQIIVVSGHVVNNTVLATSGSQDGFIVQTLGRPIYFPDPSEIALKNP